MYFEDAFVRKLLLLKGVASDFDLVVLVVVVKLVAAFVVVTDCAFVVDFPLDLDFALEVGSGVAFALLFFNERDTAFADAAIVPRCPFVAAL